MKFAITFILLFGFLSPTASAKPLVSKLSKAEIAGAIFKDPRLVKETHKSAAGPIVTEDVETFLSSDRLFDSGMYRSGPSHFVIDEAYGVDEFMYFLEGGVTLTNSDGSVIEVTAGDAVTIAKEWTGTWKTSGYTKIYVIYSPDAPLAPKE